MLPWKQFPVNEQVRVVVRFITPDKRAYEADKDIKVRVVPGAPQRRPEPLMEVVPVPESGPTLLPTGRETPPHTTQWRALDPERAVTIGRPTPIKE